MINRRKAIQWMVGMAAASFMTGIVLFYLMSRNVLSAKDPDAVEMEAFFLLVLFWFIALVLLVASVFTWSLARR